MSKKIFYFKKIKNKKSFFAKIISKVKNWLIQGGIITPHLNEFAVANITKTLEDIYPGIGLNFILTFHQKQGDLSNWVFDENYMKSRGKYLENHPEIVDYLFRLWQKKIKKFNECVKKLEKKGIKNFEKDYKEFSEKYSAEYGVALFTEYFTVWSDIIINRILKKLPKELYPDLEKVTRPYKKTFLNKEELAALKIGLLLIKISQKEKILLSRLKLNYLKKNFPKIFEKIKKHQEKFYWIQSNYKYTEPVTIKKFFQNIKRSVKHLTEKEIKEKIKFLENYEINFERERKKILKKLKLSTKEKRSLILISKITWLHDMRKMANLIGSFWSNKFLARASKILKIKRLYLQFTFRNELFEMLKGNGPSLKELKKRLEGCVTYHDRYGNSFFIVGERFKWLKRKILERNFIRDIKDFRGTPASYGRVRGRVKIITNPLKQKFPKGYILVAPMTRPDYVPLIRRALAVITDEGGITSHAAVVSREFNIPCVVGTKIATKVLKDNDLVEVSAVHGIVRIITKNY